MDIGWWVLVFPLCGLLVWLMTKQVFWAVTGGVCLLASAHNCMMCIIKAEITMAVAYSALTVFLVALTEFLMELTAPE